MSAESSYLPPKLIGMVHLLPLPGTPRYAGSKQEILDRALHDALVLTNAGFDALLVENYGDTPFHKDQVEEFIISEMSVIIASIRQMSPLQCGVQVLRNDAQAALAIASSTGCHFVRINVHTGAMLTDQGIVEGRADQTLRMRSLLQARVKIFADIHVKHAEPLGSQSIEDSAVECLHRGLADALIVSGRSTGSETDPQDVQCVKRVVDAPIIIGSGVTVSNVSLYLSLADSVIVGTSIKKDRRTVEPVDERLVSSFVNLART